MYSAVVLGWPSININPKRVMSRPTEIMLVARATSTCCLSSKLSSSRDLVLLTSEVLTREVSSNGSLAILRLAYRPISSSARLRWPWVDRREVTSSSTSRRVMPSSLIVLK